MKLEDTKLEGVKIIIPDVHCDDRGFFFELYQTEKYREMGIKDVFVQDNQSCSKYGTIRGLHYQINEFAQGKLVHVLLGRILDVIVDIRFGSPTFGHHLSFELIDDDHQLIWIPPGFAHGFSVLSEKAHVFYKCTAFYSPEHERGLLYNDPTLAIDWKVRAQLVSDKDMKHPPFEKIQKDFIYTKK